MNLTVGLGQGLSYTGSVEGVRQRYFVFEGPDAYVVFSLSSNKPNSGNFNLVSRKAVDYVYRKFGGEDGVTANDVAERSNRSKHVPKALIALNILYILVAQERASIDGTGSYSKLYFSVLLPGAKATAGRKVASKKVPRRRAPGKVAVKVAKNGGKAATRTVSRK